MRRVLTRSVCAVRVFPAVYVEEMAWGYPLADFPRVFAPREEPASDGTTLRLAAGAPYDLVLGADLLYNPSLYPLLLPTVLQLLAIGASCPPEQRTASDCSLVAPSLLRPQESAGQVMKQPQFGSQHTVVYMCYMERGGEDAFFSAAEAQGVLCDQPKLFADLATLSEDLGCVMVRMRNATAVSGSELGANAQT